MTNEKKKIAELKAGDNAIVEGDVLEVFEVKEMVKKDGQRIILQEVLIDDKSAGITLKLWDKQVNTLKEKDRVRVVGYVSSFRDVLGISTGKFGKIEVL
jgi:ssDNA-binding replication factor A large subunit